MVCQSDIYVDQAGSKYSKLITISFNKHTIDVENGTKIISIDDVQSSDIKNDFKALTKKWGNFKLEKAVPSAIWGDTIKINKRTGKTVFIKDMSQIFYLEFENLVPVDSLINLIKGINYIKNIEGPYQAYLATTPNDYYYTNGNEWEFSKINAPGAWGITQGSSSVRISMNDYFGTLGTLHDDLSSKVDYRI
jgi:hypothetical protein